MVYQHSLAGASAADCVVDAQSGVDASTAAGVTTIDGVLFFPGLDTSISNITPNNSVYQKADRVRCPTTLSIRGPLGGVVPRGPSFVCRTRCRQHR
jgi:hypothetical protein